MITIICGDPGRGKTALATALGVGAMVSDTARQAVRDSEYLTAELRATGYPNLRVPQDHLVYADYAIQANINGNVVAKSKEADGFRFGLYTPEWETQFIPPKATIIFDEAQIYYDSKRSARLPEFVTRAYAMHRHNYYHIVLVSQRPVSIDKSIRSLSEQFIYITDMRNIPNCLGQVVCTIWDCVEFNNTSSAERYSDTKLVDVNGVVTQYVYIDNIFECYDSHGKFALFYNGRENSKFANADSAFINWNGNEVRNYNKSHAIETPDIFLRQKPKKAEEKEREET